MEILLPAALYQRRPLVWQVDELLETEPGSVIVRQHGEIGKVWLANDIPCPRLIQEHIVHDAAPPYHDPMLATEPNVSH